MVTRPVRRVDLDGPGLRRRRAGRGFTYLHPNGRRVRDRRLIARIEALAIPPAWHDVWICPDPDGHVQAVGVDDRGRRQYRYHPAWREARDREKHDRAVAMAQALPRLRERVAADLARDDLGRDRVLAAAIRLLEAGFFRVGSESYVADNGSFGLATIQQQHVRVRAGRVVVFDYPAKSGRRRKVVVEDPDVVPVVQALKRRRSGGPELLAYKDEAGRWVDIRSTDVNDYLREAIGEEFSTKDVRTWAGTVLAAVALSKDESVPEAMREVAEQLGNTPQVVRSSYVDPRVLDHLDEEGATLGVDPELAEGDAVEAAVVDLVTDGGDG
jgi:DNA topoisomerase-1